jgi:hypothetical protein
MRERKPARRTGNKKGEDGVPRGMNEGRQKIF